MRWAWAGIVALLAALAVLVHHDTTSVAMPAPAASSMGTMPGMNHGLAAVTQIQPSSGHEATVRDTNTSTGNGSGPCSGPVMEHCSAGDIGSVKIAPSPAVPHTDMYAVAAGSPVGHGPPGRPYRAPPDLSVLSRLLI